MNSSSVSPMPSTAGGSLSTSPRKRWLLACCAAFGLLLAAGAGCGYALYRAMFGPGLALSQPAEWLYITEEETYQALFDTLRPQLLHPQVFDWMAGRMHYRHRVRPGRYALKQDMSNRQLLLMLRSGAQTPVDVTFRPFRFPEQLAGTVSAPLSCDSAELVALLRDPSYLADFGVTPQTVLTLFIPDTYQFMWNTSADGFVRRMFREYNRFWEGARDSARMAEGLTRTEAGILASIVEEETQRRDDRPMVARVYLNRLRLRMPLQADPTVRYALGDFTIRRVLTAHLSIDSPYNTYRIAGLPVGPICCPSAEAVDAVLFAPRHDYLYFCAAPDMETLRFARTLREHNRNAADYQRELNRLKIWR